VSASKSFAHVSAVFFVIGFITNAGTFAVKVSPSSA
jgi:hypothetical protein